MTRAGLLEQLVDAIGPAGRVAIDGPDAAGKTILADELAIVLREQGREVVRGSIDDFHRPEADRYRRGRDSPLGYYEDSFDHAAVREAVLGVEGMLVFDGIFLLRPELRDLWDFAVFVSVSFDEVIRRALERDVPSLGSAEEVERRYRVRYIPGQELYFAESRPMDVADVVVENDDPAAPRLRGGGADPPSRPRR